MKTLFIDIASHTAVVACSTESDIVSMHQTDLRIGDAELIPIIENTLKQAGWKYADLTNLACIVGPGGFTGLRVVVSCINLLADQLHIPSVGIHLSNLYKARCSSDSLLWIHSTKKHEVFVCGFGLDKWEEPTHIEIDQLRRDAPKNVQWTGELIDEHRVVIDEMNINDAPLTSIESILPAFLSNQTYNEALLLPWYGRGW